MEIAGFVLQVLLVVVTYLFLLVRARKLEDREYCLNERELGLDRWSRSLGELEDELNGVNELEITEVDDDE